MARKKEKVSTARNLLLCIGGGLFGTYLVIIFIESMFFSHNFGPFVKIADISVGFKSKAEVKSLIETKWADYLREKILFAGRNIKIGDLVASTDLDSTLDDALARQRAGILTFDGLFFKNYSIKLALDDSKVSPILSKEFDRVARPATDAEIVLDGENRIMSEKEGQRLLLSESTESLLTALGQMQYVVVLRYEETKPTLTKDEAEKLVSTAESITSNDLTVQSESGVKVIMVSELKSWLKIRPKNPNSLVVVDNFLPKEDDFTFFDQNKVADWVSNFSKKTDQTEKNAILGAVDGKVTVTTPSITGFRLDQADLISKLIGYSGNGGPILAKIDTISPQVSEESLASLGLSELISTGQTDFSGSPANRKHNFTLGASKFNGVLIKPDENFSFNTTLGPVDAASGYLPELVILTDKTVPEYGGGMCQVSSTAFRAALNAGLPILERTAHAYPVGYYKPYGVDATIYLPKPDLVFKNDTGHYIFIQTRIGGTKLNFDFYGTKKPVVVKFSGNANAVGAVDTVEKITPTLTDQGARGPKSFTATFYRHIYDLTGKLTDNDKFTSKYDSPDKYPH